MHHLFPCFARFARGRNPFSVPSRVTPPLPPTTVSFFLAPFSIAAPPGQTGPARRASRPTSGPLPYGCLLQRVTPRSAPPPPEPLPLLMSEFGWRERSSWRGTSTPHPFFPLRTRFLAKVAAKSPVPVPLARLTDTCTCSQTCPEVDLESHADGCFPPLGLGHIVSRDKRAHRATFPSTLLTRAPPSFPHACTLTRTKKLTRAHTHTHIHSFSGAFFLALRSATVDSSRSLRLLRSSSSLHRCALPSTPPLLSPVLLSSTRLAPLMGSL